MSTVAKTTIGATARERSRRRKAIYAIAIIALIVVLFELGKPSTLDEDKNGRPGGVLAQYRDKHALSQTELGVIDPMSETVRLGTLGMRGVGSSVLWWTATQFQMKKDWTQLSATLDQISKLQPHSIAVWRYQAWNLSYNVSVAFDDYHDKFFWVIKGLDFMLGGVRLNDKEPRLYWDMGWFISNKIGRADEAKYYRRLFAGKKDTSETAADFRRGAGDDDAGKDFAPYYVKEFREKAVPPTGFPHGADVRDNWHVGKAWFLASESKIDPPRYPVRGMADVIFYSDAPNTQFYYADNLEKDGRFDQVAVNAWKQATREWNAFGDMAIDTSYDMKLQLNRQEEMEAASAKDLKTLDEMVPGEREKLRKEKLEQLKKDHPYTWAAWNILEDKRTTQQNQLVYNVRDRMDVKNDEVAPCRQGQAAGCPETGREDRVRRDDYPVHQKRALEGELRLLADPRRRRVERGVHRRESRSMTATRPLPRATRFARCRSMKRECGAGERCSTVIHRSSPTPASAATCWM